MHGALCKSGICTDVSSSNLRICRGVVRGAVNSGCMQAAMAASLAAEDSCWHCLNKLVAGLADIGSNNFSTCKLFTHSRMIP